MGISDFMHKDVKIARIEDTRQLSRRSPAIMQVMIVIDQLTCVDLKRRDRRGQK